MTGMVSTRKISPLLREGGAAVKGSNSRRKSCSQAVDTQAKISAASLFCCSTSRSSFSPQKRQFSKCTEAMKHPSSSIERKRMVVEFSLSKGEQEMEMVTQSAVPNNGTPGVPLNHDEVIELLRLSINVLLKKENVERLRERLWKSKQNILKKESLQSSKHIGLIHSLAPMKSSQDLEVVSHSEVARGVDTHHKPIESASIPSSHEKQTRSIPKRSVSEIMQTGGQHKLIQNSLATAENVENKVKVISRSFAEITEISAQSKPIQIAPSVTTDVDQGIGGSSLTDIRRLKVLDVHSYVHNALRNSAMKSWLKSRKIHGLE